MNEEKKARPEKIVVDNVSGGYGEMEILTDISMFAGPGEIVSLIGPNGAGKSTLLSMIAGTLLPNSGEILLEGSDITYQTANNRLKSGMAFVPQGRSVFSTMSVEENLLMGGYTLDTEKTKERVEEIFNLFPELKEYAEKRSTSLSGGQQQMLELGRGLIVEPTVLLVDEPSLGLAPALRKKIFDVIQNLINRGISVIMVEQNVYEALEISDRAYVLANGQIRFEGTSEEILSDDRLGELYLS